MYFNLRLCVLAFGFVNIFSTHLYSNKTYCSYKTPVLGDDEVYPIFPDISYFLEEKKHTKLSLNNRWTKVGRVMKNISKSKFKSTNFIKSLYKRYVKNVDTEKIEDKKENDINYDIYARLLLSV